MIVLKILDTKDMMSHLLLKETFDNWFLVEAQVTTFARLSIAGRRNKNWYDQEADQTDLIGWGEMRSFLFQYIRGKRSPEAFTFSLKLSEMAAKDWIREEGLYQRIHDKKVELLLQFRYEKDSLHLVTGISQLEFTMDKHDENSWDILAPQILKALKISFDENV